MRVEHEGGVAAWLVGTLVVLSVQGHGLPRCRSYGPIRVFFQDSVDDQKASLVSLSL